MLVQDPETGEWYDDGLGEEGGFIDPDPSGLGYREPRSIEEIPPRPPIVDSELGGSYVGAREGVLPDKYRARQMARAERPSPISFGDAPKGGYGAPDAGSGSYDPETSAMITGYGKNLMMRKAGNPAEQPWLTPSGDMAPAEYVQDIERTIGEVDRGEMSETQLGEKIKRNEGIIPPGRRPSEGEVNIVDFVNFHMNDVEPKLREQAKAAREQYIKSVSLTTRSLNEAGYDAKGAEIEQKTYNELRNEEKALATKHAERLQKREDAKNTPKTTSDSIRVALRAELGRDPTEREVLTETAKFNAESVGAKEKAKTEAKGTFKDWTDEAKEQEFTLHMISGKPPVSAAGLGGGDRQQYGKEYAQWKTDKGIRPQDVALMQADYKSGDMSLRNMAKQEAPMEAFVGNINKQIDKVKQLYDNNDRTGLRLIDLPVRELKMRAIGSGDEAVKASYLLEISNEIGKLSSGSSASVQQLSDSAKEDWKRVHDPNLSLSEIMKVINATRDQANMRLETWKSAKQTVRNQIKSIGELEGGTKPIPEPQAPSKPKFIIKRVN